MIFLYTAALFFIVLAHHGYGRTLGSVDEHPMPGTTPFYYYELFGNRLSDYGIYALLIFGFVYLSWWIPIAALFCSLLLAALVYEVLPMGSIYAIFGFPLGTLLGAAWIFIKLNQ